MDHPGHWCGRPSKETVWFLCVKCGKEIRECGGCVTFFLNKEFEMRPRPPEGKPASETVRPKLKDMGSKCIIGQHDGCGDSSCQCQCHVRPTEEKT